MITFDAAVHRYTEDGVVLPSVTQILKIAGKINLSWRTSARGAFGREVHEATAAFDRGEKVISDFYLPVAFYVVGWWIWRETAEAKILEVERVVGWRELGFAGTCDRVVTIDGERQVLDLKTGAPYPWHRLQLAGYAIALGVACRRMAVYLDGACGSRVRKYQSDGDLEEFRRILEAVKLWAVT